MSDLCVCMRDVISEFNCLTVGDQLSVKCAFTSPVSIESGMLVTCRMQYVMSVPTVL